MPALITDKCSDVSYRNRSKFKLIVKDRLDGSTLHTVDMFQSLSYNQGLNLYEVHCTPGLDAAGEFSYSFNDREHIIDMNKVGKGNIVILQVAKQSATDYENIFYGLCRDMTATRPAANILRWTMTGFGTQVIFNEILCTFIRSAERLSLQDPRPRINDDKMRGFNLFTDFLTNKDVPIYGDKSLADIGGFTTNGIDPNVRDVVTAISAKNQYASSISKTITDSIGAISGIDANNDAYLRYPTKKHLNVTVKVPQSKTEFTTDYGFNTSYVIGPYSAPQSLQLPDYANIVTGRATIERQFLDGSDSGDSDSVKTTNGQALGQRFIPSSLGFKDIALYLKKIGDPTSSKKRLNGSIILDHGNTPTNGKKVAQWYINLDDITSSPSAVSPAEIKILTKTIEASTPHWIVVYERAGNNSGDFDPENTIQWINNGDTTTPGQFSAIAQGGDKDATNLQWQVFPNGPTFAYSLFQVTRRQSFAVDPLAIDRFGPIMVPIDATFIDDSFTLNKFLHVDLQQRSRPKINFSEIVATIPNNVNFKPGYMVTFLDPVNPMFTQDKYIQPLISRVTWDWNALTEPQGARTVKLLLSARYDWVSEYFTE